MLITDCLTALKEHALRIAGQRGGNPHLNADARVAIANHRLWNKSNGSEGRRGTLSGLDLRNSKFDNMDLCAFDFSGSNLQGASFQGALLRFCDFTDCNMSKTDLTEADLRGAAFRNTDLSAANLTRANLASADILDEQGRPTGKKWPTLLMNTNLDAVIKLDVVADGIKYVGECQKLATLFIMSTVG